MKIGLITRHDLLSGRPVGGGLAYRRQLYDVLRRHHDVELVEIKVPRRRGLGGRITTQLELARALAQVRGEKDLWIRDFRELAFLGPLRTRGRNLVVIHHIDARPLPNRLYNETLDSLCMRRLAQMDTVVTVSRYWQERIQGKGISDVRVIYNTIDQATTGRAPAGGVAEFRGVHGLGSGPIIYIGNCQPAKGADLAHGMLSGEGYALATSGPCQIQPPCPNLEGSYDEYLELLTIADAAVLLSQFDEGWCRTAHEAMLCGTPVIGSGRGGMRELLEGGDQFIAEDPDEVRSILKRLLADPGWAKEVGERGRVFAAQFTRERFEREWLDAVNRASVSELAPRRAAQGDLFGDRPLVSVILPVHNREHTIAGCLESILSQSYPALEVIVVDDGSTDGTPEILKTYEDRIQVIHQPNAGPYVARNRALERAKGAYIAFVDSDDLLHPERLARQVECLERDADLALAYTYVAYRTQDGERWVPPDSEQIDLEGDLSRRLIAAFGGNIPWPTAMVRHTALELAGPFDTAHRVAMDRELGMRLAQVGKFAVLREPLYEYTLHDEHISQHISPREAAAEHVWETIRSGQGLYGAHRGDRGLLARARGEMSLQLARLSYSQWMYGRSIRHCAGAIGSHLPVLWRAGAFVLLIKAILGGLGTRRLFSAGGQAGRRQWQRQPQSTESARARGAVSADPEDEDT